MPANNKFTIDGGLTRRHRVVIDDFFERGLSERQVAARHGLTVDKLREWCEDSAFRREVSSRLFAPVSQAWIMLARSAPDVARRLIELTHCEKDDTARKACLDILTALPRPSEEALSSQPGTDEDAPLPFSHETAMRMLELLANDEGQSKAKEREARRTPPVSRTS